MAHFFIVPDIRFRAILSNAVKASVGPFQIPRGSRKSALAREIIRTNYNRMTTRQRTCSADFAVYKPMCQTINTSEINHVNVGNNQFVECIPSLLTYWSVPSIFALLEAGRYVILRSVSRPRLAVQFHFPPSMSLITVTRIRERLNGPRRIGKIPQRRS